MSNSIDIIVKCGECGKELESNISTNNFGDIELTADACECLTEEIIDLRDSVRLLEREVEELQHLEE